MDFFEAQAHAKKRTARLVTLFVFAVIGTVLASYFAAVLILGQTRGHRRDYRDDPPSAIVTWDPQLFVGVAIGTLAVIGIAAMVKWSQFSAGGSAVAEMVGGRRVDPRTTDLHERQLLNVVEEMAIASSVPTPPVYVLDGEPALNAFAAGLTSNDAVVTVTRGTLEKLSRDELQGVVAHEFSHILNGDMRLNVRLTAILFGILVLGLAGRGILYTLGRGRVRLGGGKKGGGGIAVVLAAGLALLIIGYVGYFFGRLIQAAVSRQREFLADASAVQFTRNPGGISGALKKIGGYALGSQVNENKAAQIGHFFFAQSFRSSFGGLWATHPPLADRIRAIDPQWDGQLFEPPEVVDVRHESFQTAGFAPPLVANAPARGISAASDTVPPLLPSLPIPFQAAAAAANAGALTEGHFRQAQALLEKMPTALREAARDPARAQFVIYGLLLSEDPALRDKQLALVQTHAGAAAAAALVELGPALGQLAPDARLPLLQLALPALSHPDATELDRFLTTLDELVHADGQVTPFEYALQKVLTRHLQLVRAPQVRVEFYSFQAVADDIAVVLSTLARVGARDETQAATACAVGAAQLKLIETRLTLLAPADCTLEHLDQTLDRLALASLPIKKRLLDAAAHVIGADGTITLEEGELFRALAAALDVPMPVLEPVPAAA